MGVARVAYRVVEIEVDKDELDALSEVRPRSQSDATVDVGGVDGRGDDVDALSEIRPRFQSDATVDVGGVDGRIARRHDGPVTTCRRTNHVHVTLAVCSTNHTDDNVQSLI